MALTLAINHTSPMSLQHSLGSMQLDVIHLACLDGSACQNFDQSMRLAAHTTTMITAECMSYSYIFSMHHISAGTVL